jgi:hypothetical protein
MKKYFWILTLLALSLNSCGSFASPPPPTPAPLPIATLTPSPIPMPVIEMLLPTQPSAPTQPIERVLIVTFKGLRPDAIADAGMNSVLDLMHSGAYTLNAQTTIPSLTLPAHASMLTGTCPAKHVVRWDQYVPANGTALGTDIFDLAHAAGLRTVLLSGKEKLRHVTDSASTDFFAFVDKTDKILDNTSVLRLALNQINEGFGLMVVHFDDGGLEGEVSGWMSRTQLEVYGREDRGLASMLQTLKDKGMYESTLIIVTSDHGGHETSTGTTSPEDMTIPWVISGPRVVPGELQTPVYIMDTAATVAFALGFSLPTEWDGIPVYEAFGLPADSTRNGGCPGLTP